MDLSIIIVSWNVAALLEQCLKSIESSLAAPSPYPQPKTEVIVVDSASHDETVARTQAGFPWVKVLAQSENVGFTRGNNIGLEAAQGQYLFLLNPDTEIIGDALARLVAYMNANPKVGIIGPHTLNTDGTTQSSRRRFLTPGLAFFESTWLQGYAPKEWLDDFYVTEALDTAVLEVDWVQGSAIMARRKVYEQIGGLDTGYVMYSEEMDWCKRAKDKGWSVVYYGQAQITHHGGKSTEQAGANKHIYFQESKLRYLRKYHGYRTALIMRIFLLLSYFWQIAVEGVKTIISPKRTMRPERLKRIQTYWRVLRSGLKVS
jgi:N-acetylglucosaminyl-diphospho-decaprenol L-rhamnosyltransferase